MQPIPAGHLKQALAQIPDDHYVVFHEQTAAQCRSILVQDVSEPWQVTFGLKYFGIVPNYEPLEVPARRMTKGQ